jgi:hypothetical protein
MTRPNFGLWVNLVSLARFHEHAYISALKLLKCRRQMTSDERVIWKYLDEGGEVAKSWRAVTVDKAEAIAVLGTKSNEILSQEFDAARKSLVKTYFYDSEWRDRASR